MSQHLDLEEQEQLAEFKHFWNQYGNLITWILVLILGAYAAWNGYRYWRNQQALDASTLFGEVESAAQAADTAKLDRVLADMKDKFGATTYAQQAALLAAKTYNDKGNIDAAKAALSWVMDKSSDPGYQAVARLRLASVLAQAKNYDEAIKLLSVSLPSEFAALGADRLGDIYTLQGQRPQAQAAYQKAYDALDEKADYRRVVAVKLNALGVDVQAQAHAAAASASAPASVPASAEAKK